MTQRPITDMASEKGGAFQGKVAIITGGSSGIGRAVSLALAKEGAAVVVVGRNKERIRKAVEEVEAGSISWGFPRRVVGLDLDVCREEDMERMAERTLSHFGRIDILVASAGILRSESRGPTPLMHTTTEEFDRVIETNLKGVFLSNRAVARALIEQRAGQIINISSLSGRQALPFDAPYCASKFGVIGFTQSIAEELRPYGVRVQLVLPGSTDTPIWAQNKPVPRAANVLPVERIADLILFVLAWPENSLFEQVIIAPLRTMPQPLWKTNQ